MSKALFLDRDGTLIYDKDYLSDPGEVELVPGTDIALQMASDLGYLLFLVTNQSGIGRGYYTMADYERVNARMLELLKMSGDVFAEICVAPERPDESSEYRKPSPKFIKEMIAKYDLDPGQCYMIGDKQCDVLTGMNAGINPIAVGTGKDSDRAQFEELATWDTQVYTDLLAFVKELEQAASSSSS